MRGKGQAGAGTGVEKQTKQTNIGAAALKCFCLKFLLIELHCETTVLSAEINVIIAGRVSSIRHISDLIDFR